MAPNWADAAEELATILREGTSFEASPNPQDLELPGYWVTPISRSFDTLDGAGYTSSWEIWAICPNYTTPVESLDKLSDMHDQLRALDVFVGAGTAEIASILLTNKAADAMPAAKITVSVEVE